MQGFLEKIFRLILHINLLRLGYSYMNKQTKKNKGEQLKVEINQNTRGFETMEKGRKVRGKDRFHVKLTDNQKRVYETKTSYNTETIKKYFRNGEYRIFVRNMKTGETNIKRVG